MVEDIPVEFSLRHKELFASLSYYLIHIYIYIVEHDC